MKLLLDVNVLLDILLDRPPHAAAAAAVWAAIEGGRAKGYVPAHGLTTMHYLVARERGRRIARRAVEAVLVVCEVAPVDARVIRNALTFDWNDFGDAVCAAAAMASRCDAIISRDPSGFRRSPVPVIDPRVALVRLRTT